MKACAKTVAVLLFSILFVCQSRAAGVPDKVFLDLENKISRAVVTADTAEMDRLFASDYVSVGVSGQIRQRSEVISAYSRGTLHLTAVHGEDMTVRSYDTFAIVIGHVTVSGTDGGKNISGHYTFSRVYRLEDGHWRAISYQATPLL